MALFVISGTDQPGRLDQRLALRQAHLDYVADHPGVVRLGGPYLGEDGAMAGSLLIVETQDLAAAKAFHAADPYTRADLFERSTVRPWRVTMGTLD